jgi:hypothetical protein
MTARDDQRAAAHVCRRHARAGARRDRVGAGAMNRREEEIDAAKVEALVDVLKTALPELVVIAFGAFKAELPRILPGLTDRK